jgi:hypothetical protein
MDRVSQANFYFFMQVKSNKLLLTTQFQFCAVCNLADSVRRGLEASFKPGNIIYRSIFVFINY